MPPIQIVVNGVTYTVSTNPPPAGAMPVQLGFGWQPLSQAVANAAMSLGQHYVGNPAGQQAWLTGLINSGQLHVW
jgi:hypothetical protein